MNTHANIDRASACAPRGGTLSAEEIAGLKELDPRIQRELAAAKVAFANAKTDSGKAAVALDYWRVLAADAAEGLWLVISSSAAYREGRDSAAQRLASMEAARDQQIAIMRKNGEVFEFQPEGFEAAAAEVISTTFADTFARLSATPTIGGRA